ncbi:unnamed protein product [Ceratitis capitata]|uniref:(Mediterranean fruit fly) hypothetical protein n=1 Tax=Ceratitis capitata TaxID=7213 RepID=A0A811UJR1_CERCA|nr:unnamed protein product [Ceratitis capitata]
MGLQKIHLKLIEAPTYLNSCTSINKITAEAELCRRQLKSGKLQSGLRLLPQNSCHGLRVIITALSAHSMSLRELLWQQQSNIARKVEKLPQAKQCQAMPSDSNAVGE